MENQTKNWKAKARNGLVGLVAGAVLAGGAALSGCNTKMNYTMDSMDKMSTAAENTKKRKQRVAKCDFKLTILPFNAKREASRYESNNSKAIWFWQ